VSPEALDEAFAEVHEPDTFGSGPFQRRLNVFNWGASLLPEVWPFFNGMPEIGVAYWSLVFGVAAVTLNVPDRGGAQGLLLLLPELVVIVLTIAFGAKANAMRWTRQARALEAQRARVVFTTAQYLAWQRRWMIGGFIAMGFSVALVLVPVAAAGLTREWSMAVGVLIARLTAAAIVATRLASDRDTETGQ